MKNCLYNKSLVFGIIMLFFGGILIQIIAVDVNAEDTAQNGDIKIIRTEELEGIYDPEILYEQIYFNGTWYDFEMIRYTKNGKEHVGAYKPQMKGALDWIKFNTDADCTILCWWDHGHMIEGYAERNAMAEFASLSLKYTIADYNRLDEEGKQEYEEEHEWCSDDIIEDIANVLTSENIFQNDIKNILDDNNIKYILTRGYDKQISEVFFDALGKESSEYVVDGTPTIKGSDTLIFRMWENNPEINGLELVKEYESFEDEFYDVRVFLINDEITDNNGDSGTPGFEVITVFLAIALILFLKRKRKL
jgi:hypothetical protein